jgi:hypothetical protein
MEVGIAIGHTRPCDFQSIVVQKSLGVIERWTIAVLCVLLTGCTVCENARRTLIIEPSAFYWKTNKQRSLAVYSAWADAAWSEESQGCLELIGRAEYGIGFRDGFVDYVYAGGTGEPPPIPPRHLWNVDFRSEEGHQRAEDWFAGYRHGVQVARDGGYRSIATLRSSILGMERRPSGIYGDDIWQGPGYDTDGNWPTTESLPAPDEATAPEMNAPQEPKENVEPTDAVPTTQAPTDRSETGPPASRPIVPPPPRNLPPTTPRTVPLPSNDVPPLPQNKDGLEPGASRATEPEATDQLDSTPPFLPNEGRELAPPADEEPNSEPTTPEPMSSSLRIIRTPSLANRSPRAMPMITPPASRIRPKPIGERMSVRSQGPIRLTVASSPAKSATLEGQASSIRIHPDSNDQGDR